MKNKLGHLFNLAACAAGSLSMAYGAVAYHGALADAFTCAAAGIVGAGLLVAGYSRLLSPQKLAGGLRWMADTLDPQSSSSPGRGTLLLDSLRKAVTTRAAKIKYSVTSTFHEAAMNRKYSQRIGPISQDIGIPDLAALLKKGADLEIASERLPNDLFIPTIAKREPDGPVDVGGRSVRLVLVHAAPDKKNPISPEHYTLAHKGFQLMLVLDQPGEKPDVLARVEYWKTPFGYRRQGGGMSRYNTDAIFPVLQNEMLKEIPAKAAENGSDNVARTLYAPWRQEKHPPQGGFKPI